MSDATVSDLAPRYHADMLQDRVTGVVLALMAVKRVSQKDIAHQLEIATSTLSSKLNGKRRWTIDELGELGVVFNVNPQVFLRRPEEVFAVVFDANSPDDEGGVRHQGLEPRTQWLKVCEPYAGDSLDELELLGMVA